MKTIQLYIKYMLAAFCFAQTLTACDEHPHEDENGVVFTLSWQNSDDSGTKVSDVMLWIDKADGTAVHGNHYTNPSDMAGHYHALEKGDYRALTVTNLVSPFTINRTVSGTAANRAADANEDPVMISLSDPGASPSHAHFAVADFTYSGSGIKVASQPLTRVLAEFSLTIVEVPEGASLTLTVTDAAKGILPLSGGSEGSLFTGTPTEERTPATFDAMKASSGTISTDILRLMPTVSGNTNSHLRLTLTLADGTQTITEALAPVMKSAGKYHLELKYSDLRQHIVISVHSISNWEEGWKVNEEILNPNE